MTTKQLDLDDDKYFKQEYPGLKETRSYLQHAKLLIDANLPNAREAERFSSRAFGKQFIVTFFNFDNQHWVAAISDQAEGHLYVYDTTYFSQLTQGACGPRYLLPVRSHHILCNELGLGSLTELREKLPAEKLPTDKRKDECYDSRFCESVTGEPISLVLSKKGPWRSKEAVDGHALLYVKEEQDDGGAL
ncbi:hypothetical protein TASIC1_0017014200 [Trichoderma asperellum]|uniref:Uncharacterized protein n=1 Tax=Trichoderma asperellum TaxID=101201 RepID=A0A6V8R6Y4_TRIAP|nr:hypothetical protein TASIC1_0017014200 [Trichoderma asperellum]